MISSLFRIGIALLRSSLMASLQYRADFWFHALAGVVRTGVAVAPLWLVLQHAPSVAGWSGPSAALIMAFFLLLQALQGGFLEPNLGEVVEAIRDGRLDLWLLKPVDAQALVSLRKVDPTYLGDGIAAAAIAAYAISLQPPASALDAVIAAYLLGCGLVSMYGLWLAATCTSFFWVRVDNLRYLLMSASDAGRWPRQVFGPWIRLVLTAVVPVAVVTSFPAEALRARWTLAHLASASVIAVVFGLGSRRLWLRSLARYTSASS
jgi:ABC-2 type transport system permease protein